LEKKYSAHAYHQCTEIYNEKMSENLSFCVYKGKPYSLFYCLQNFREDICAIEIYQQRFPSGWIFFEDPNSRGSSVDHIEICRGEISGI
jgi:hypothetical protein